MQGKDAKHFALTKCSESVPYSFGSGDPLNALNREARDIVYNCMLLGLYYPDREYLSFPFALMDICLKVCVFVQACIMQISLPPNITTAIYCI